MVEGLVALDFRVEEALGILVAVAMVVVDVVLVVVAVIEIVVVVAWRHTGS